MNRNSLRAMLAAGGVLLLAGSVRAHHGHPSMLDGLEPVTVTGVIAEVRLENPHLVFIVDVVDEAGRVARWSFEGNAPTAAIRGGFRRDSVRAGDTVTIKGAHVREKWLNMGVAREIVLEDGRSFLVGPRSVG